MPQVLTIAIPDELVAELRDLAHGEYRNPRNQATVLLIDAIRRAAAERRDARTSGQLRETEPADRPTAAKDEAKGADRGVDHRVTGQA